MWLAILGVLKGFLDLLNPWSSYRANKTKVSDEKRDMAQKKIDDAAKKGDFDAFYDGLSDKRDA